MFHSIFRCLFVEISIVFGLSAIGVGAYFGFSHFYARAPFDSSVVIAGFGIGMIVISFLLYSFLPQNTHERSTYAPGLLFLCVLAFLLPAATQWLIHS